VSGARSAAAGALAVFAALAALAAGCGSVDRAAVPAPAPAAMKSFSTAPADGFLVFIGAAGRRSRPGESVDLALRDAARRLAIFREVGVEFSMETRVGAGILDYAVEVFSTLTYDRDYERLVDELVFDEAVDVFEINQAVLARTRYPAGAAVPAAAYPAAAPGGGRPTWVDRPPEIPGYLVGVGCAGRRDAYRDTLNASYENAIHAVAQRAAATAWSRTEHVQGPGFLDYAAATVSGTRTAATLYGFYALDVWTDPDTGAVWTLAVARDARPGVSGE